MLHDESMMTARFIRTREGADVLRQKRPARLTRAARDLLFLINESRTASEWAAVVHGTTEIDVRGLLDEQLIEKVARKPPEGRTAVEILVEGFDYEQLYKLVTNEALGQLGVLAGYRTILAVERCTTLPELQVVGRRFMAKVSQGHGEAAAIDFLHRLGAGKRT